MRPVLVLTATLLICNRYNIVCAIRGRILNNNGINNNNTNTNNTNTISSIVQDNTGSVLSILTRKPTISKSKSNPNRPTKSPQLSQRCGNNKYCNTDEYCCNRSCGICVKNGEKCDKKQCTDPLLQKPLSCSSDTDCPSPICKTTTTSSSSSLQQILNDNNNNKIVSECPVGRCKNNTCTIGKQRKRQKSTVAPARKPQSIDSPVNHNTHNPNPVLSPAMIHEPVSVPTKYTKYPISVPIVGSAPVQVPVPVKNTQQQQQQQQQYCTNDEQCKDPECSFEISLTMPSFCPKNICMNNTCQIETPATTTMCGTVVCSENEYCCNESCGICLMKEEIVQQQQQQQQQKTNPFEIKQQQQQPICDSTKVCTQRTALQCRDDLDCDIYLTCNVLSGKCINRGIHCGPTYCTGNDICCNFQCGICSPIGHTCDSLQQC